MDDTKTWSLLEYSQFFADIAVVIGAITVILVVLSYRHSVNSEKTKIFNDLRSKYGEIYSDIDEYVHQEGKDAADLNFEHLKDNQKAISVLNRYWIHSFNEWFTANKIYKNDKLKLWKEFYKPAQVSALKIRLYRDSLRSLFASGHSFGDYQDEYMNVMNDLLVNECRFDGYKFETTFSQKNHLNSAFHNSKIISNGESVLNSLSDTCEPSLERLKIQLKSYIHNVRLTDQLRVEWITCVLALQSAYNQDFGVGAVWVDDDWNVIGTSRNTVFSRSSSKYHAEMNLIDKYHLDSTSGVSGNYNLVNTKIVTSLEPCPMCLSRISMTKIPNIIYLSDDLGGGMVSEKEYMPQDWINMLSNKTFYKSDNNELSEISWAIFQATHKLNLGLG